MVTFFSWKWHFLLLHMKWGNFLHASSYHQFASECLWWDGQFRRSEVWFLLGAQNFSLVPHSQRKHLSLRPVLSDWYERGKPSVFCQNFQHEWSGLFTVKLRKLWTLEIFMGCYVFPRRRPIRHKINELQTAIVIKLWFCG